MRQLLMSLSSRRAWIEILPEAFRDLPFQSLSSRRAWIEMCSPNTTSSTTSVALLTESVD